MFPKSALSLFSLKAMTFEKRYFNELMSGLLKRKVEGFFLVEESIIMLVKSLVILRFEQTEIFKRFAYYFYDA